MATVLASVASVTTSFNSIQDAVLTRSGHSQALVEIDRESEIHKAQFERYAQMGDGMTVSNYNCDPLTPPQFDSLPWAKSDGPRRVYSNDGYEIGKVHPDGSYRHFGVCRK